MKAQKIELSLEKFAEMAFEQAMDNTEIEGLSVRKWIEK